MSLMSLISAVVLPLLALAGETPKGVHVDMDDSEYDYGKCILNENNPRCAGSA